MKQNGQASIIINNYNYGSFVGQAIDSALQQTWPHVEVIVVDDGSTDNSAAVIRSYGDRIRSVFQENGGQASAMNAGFAISKGEVVIFLDSDDLLHPEVVERVMACSGPGVAKIHWQLSKINETGAELGLVIPFAETLAAGSLREELIQQGPEVAGGLPYSPPTSGNAWSRQFLEQVFPLNEPLFRSGGNDYFLSTLAPLFGSVQAIRTPMGYYRIHGRNDTLRPLEDYAAQVFSWFHHTCRVLREKLQQQGIEVPEHAWEGRTWYHRMMAVLSGIDEVLPENARFISVDDFSLGKNKTLARRHAVPFTEKDGQYNGQPADDAAAISEVERQIKNGAEYLVFLWTSFWYLDSYPGWKEYLREQFTCLLENERLIIFQLHHKQGSAQPVREESSLLKSMEP